MMKRQLRIALFKSGPYTSGGVSSVCWFLHQFISANPNYEVSLFSIETSHNSPLNVRLAAPATWARGVACAEYRWNDIPVTHFGTRFSELEFLRYQPNRLITERLNQFDLVQVVAGGPAVANAVGDIGRPVCLFMATLARLERKSILERAPLPRKVIGRAMLPLVSELEARALRRVDHIFAETEYTRQAVLRYVDPAKVTIDTIGVDTARFFPLPEECRSDEYILSVGRFDDARKNVMLLFEAYAKLRNQVQDSPKLVLAGKTMLSKAALARAKALNIWDHLELRQDVSPDELVRLYQNAALYVLSSDEEGLGIVLLEAMACGTPVVATRCGGPDSVVSGDVGFLTPTGDAQSLAERMKWMLKHHDERRRMGAAGRKLVEARFSKAVAGSKYLAVYERLLRGYDR